jgi:pyrimidine operon attenuation protein/uracil phosphoribosyltransferase
MVTDSGMETTETICNITILVLVYADDIILVGRTIGMIKDVIINLGKAAKEVNLTVSLRKINFMEITKMSSNSRMLKVNDRI